MMSMTEMKKTVIEAGKKLVESGLIARTWGNVSCRVDDKTFLITPSGRDYLTLTVDEIVQVNIADLKYDGNVKPSSEKKVHAAVYKIFPEKKFVIHTHQVNASVIGSTGLDRIVMDSHHLLGGEVVCAKYALPSTNSLGKNVEKALTESKGQAIIMKNHGALCFGENLEETFTVATELEKFCKQFLEQRYFELSDKKKFDRKEMATFALSRAKSVSFRPANKAQNISLHSERTEDGFILYNDEIEIKVTNGELKVTSISGQKYSNKKTEEILNNEVKIHERIYETNRQINYVICEQTPEMMAMAETNETLRPLLDDFAQVAGTKAKNVTYHPNKIAQALKRSSVVFVENIGALCTGKTKDDALAVGLVSQKAMEAYIGALLFSQNGKVKAINPIECQLMRFVYLKSYSKQVEK